MSKEERLMVSDQTGLSNAQRGAVPIAVPPSTRSRAISQAWLQRLTFFLPLAATCYSAALAMLIARGFPGSTMIVIAIELCLLGACAVCCGMDGLTRWDLPAVLLGYGFIVAALIVSIMIERPMVETLRATAIIVLFFMIGQRMTYRTLDRLFFWCSTITLLILILEISSLSTYVTIFEPAKFFAETRGIAASQYNDTGLFNNALGFSGRFNFGFFSGPRTSSIFLEQVSNANFACVLALYLAARIREIPFWSGAVSIATVIVILVTANSRFGSVFVFVTLIGYFVFPLLPRRTLPLASVAIAAAALAVILHNINATGDDLTGRLAYAGRKFRDADLGYYLGMHADVAVRDRDSGYSYFIGTTTIFGMLMLWLFVNFTPRMDDAPSRRLGWSVVIYFFGQLLVSSTSLLSIKTAALLWALVGCIRTKGYTTNFRGEST